MWKGAEHDTPSQLERVACELRAFPVPRPYCCFDRTVCDVAPCGKAEAWNFISSVEIQLFFSSRLLNMLASKAVSRSLRQLALAGKTFGVSHIATFSPCRCTSYLDDFFSQPAASVATKRINAAAFHSVSSSARYWELCIFLDLCSSPVLNKICIFL